jgi:hypothetical protein
MRSTLEMDTITVLRARKLMCKTIRANGEIVNYDEARLYDGSYFEVGNISDLEKVILRISTDPRSCVVRGTLIPSSSWQGIRRLLYADRETGDPATLDDLPHQWVALDMEGIDLPAGISPSDLIACAETAIEALPVAFRDAQCVAQASASHGIKPGIRMRLWYWLSRHTDGAELKRWLSGYPADASVFRAAQVIYTARPIFEPGATDPCPSRIVSLPGQAYVEVPSPEVLAPPPAAAPKPLPAVTGDKGQRYALTALVNASIRVASAPIDSRHATALSESRSLAKLVHGGLLTAMQVSETIQGAIEQAGKTRAEGEAVAKWGMAHPCGGALPKRVQ